MNPQDPNYMLITNSDGQNGQDYYSLLIDKTQIHLAEKIGLNVHRSIFIAAENALYIDDKLMPDDIKIEFKKKLNRIFNDALTKKARVSGTFGMPLPFTDF